MSFPEILLFLCPVVLIVNSIYHTKGKKFTTENRFIFITSLITLILSCWVSCNNSKQSEVQSVKTDYIINKSDTIKINIDSLLVINQRMEQYLLDTVKVKIVNNSFVNINSPNKTDNINYADSVLNQSKNLGAINNAAIQLRAYDEIGLDRLKEYTTPKYSALERQQAKQFLEMIEKDFDVMITKQFNQERAYLLNDKEGIAALRKGILLDESQTASTVVQRIDYLKTPNDDGLYSRIFAMMELKILGNQKFSMFDFNSAQRWYKSLKK